MVDCLVLQRHVPMALALRGLPTKADWTMPGEGRVPAESSARHGPIKVLSSVLIALDPVEPGTTIGARICMSWLMDFMNTERRFDQALPTTGLPMVATAVVVH